jgi:hypothetical protein
VERGQRERKGERERERERLPSKLVYEDTKRPPLHNRSREKLRPSRRQRGSREGRGWRSFLLSLALSFSQTHTQTHTRSLSLSIALSLTHSLTQALSRSLSLSLSLGGHLVSRPRHAARPRFRPASDTLQTPLSSKDGTLSMVRTTFQR